MADGGRCCPVDLRQTLSAERLRRAVVPDNGLSTWFQKPFPRLLDTPRTESRAIASRQRPFNPVQPVQDTGWRFLLAPPLRRQQPRIDLRQLDIDIDALIGGIRLEGLNNFFVSKKDLTGGASSSLPHRAFAAR